MAQHLLLDTVAAIAILETDRSLIDVLPINAEVAIPIIALGELYAGAENSGRRDQNIKRVVEFISKRQILFVDEATTIQYGIIVAHIKKKGRPIPQNDMWIAAIAVQYNLTLVTRDAHFHHINDLNLLSW